MGQPAQNAPALTADGHLLAGEILAGAGHRPSGGQAGQLQLGRELVHGGTGGGNGGQSVPDQFAVGNGDGGGIAEEAAGPHLGDQHAGGIKVRGNIGLGIVGDLGGEAVTAAGGGDDGQDDGTGASGEIAQNKYGVRADAVEGAVVPLAAAAVAEDGLGQLAEEQFAVDDFPGSFSPSCTS